MSSPPGRPAPGPPLAPLDATFAAGIAAIARRVPPTERDTALAVYALLAAAMTAQGTPGYAEVRPATLAAHLGRGRAIVERTLAALTAAGVVALSGGSRYHLPAVPPGEDIPLDWPPPPPPPPPPGDEVGPGALTVRDPLGDRGLGGDLLVALLRANGFGEAEALTLARREAPLLTALLAEPGWAADHDDPATFLRRLFAQRQPGWRVAARALERQLARRAITGTAPGATPVWLTERMAGRDIAPTGEERGRTPTTAPPRSGWDTPLTRATLGDALRRLDFSPGDIALLLAAVPELVAAWLAEPDWQAAAGDPRDFLWARIAAEEWPPRPR